MDSTVYMCAYSTREDALVECIVLKGYSTSPAHHAMGGSSVILYLHYLYIQLLHTHKFWPHIFYRRSLPALVTRVQLYNAQFLHNIRLHDVAFHPTAPQCAMCLARTDLKMYASRAIFCWCHQLIAYWIVCRVACNHVQSWEAHLVSLSIAKYNAHESDPWLSVMVDDVSYLGIKTRLG